MENNAGTYQCVVCETFWDKTQLLGESGHMTCGDALCGANVEKVSDLSKKDYVAENTSNLTGST